MDEEATPNHSTPLCTRFLENPEEELHSHASISERNFKAIGFVKENIVADLRNFELEHLQTDSFHDLIKIKKEKVDMKYARCEQKMQLNVLKRSIQEKQKAVINLTKKLTELSVKYEDLKNAVKNEDKENRSSMELLSKAVKYFTTYYQYRIEEVENIENCTFKITFIIHGKLSNYPVYFTFDKNLDTLISFDAGELLTSKQHDILFGRFKESSNFVALLCTLRSAAVRKHV